MERVLNGGEGLMTITKRTESIIERVEEKKSVLTEWKVG